MNLPQPEWVKCRWVNVNGLSWDVIQLLGRDKSLHRLAIEDLMNTRNRIKAEWCVYACGPSIDLVETLTMYLGSQRMSSLS